MNNDGVLWGLIPPPRPAIQMRWLDPVIVKMSASQGSCWGSDGQMESEQVERGRSPLCAAAGTPASSRAFGSCSAASPASKTSTGGLSWSCSVDEVREAWAGHVNWAQEYRVRAPGLLPLHPSRRWGVTQTHGSVCGGTCRDCLLWCSHWLRCIMFDIKRQ